MINIGILAIQGGFLEHETAFKRCMLSDNFITRNITLNIKQVRSSDDITPDLHGLVIPGGESTTMGRILNKGDFGERLKDFVRGNVGGKDSPYVWGTCSGLIMLANNISNQKTGGQYHIGGIDVTVSRNYFGRQVNSFEAPVLLHQGLFSDDECHGVFIRAPAVTSCDNDDVVVLGRISVMEISEEPVIVAVQQKRLLATSFHPELTEELLWHKHFLTMILSENLE